MKKFLSGFLVAILLVCSSCKKDLLNGLDGKMYIEEHTCASTTIGACFQQLMLYPGTRAGFLPGGDIFYEASYSTSGKKLKVKWGNKEVVFIILSDSKLKDKATGKIWNAE